MVTTNALRFSLSTNVFTYITFSWILIEYRILSSQVCLFSFSSLQMMEFFLSFDLHSFWWKFSCHLNCCPSIRSMLIYTGCFIDSLYLSFSAVQPVKCLFQLLFISRIFVCLFLTVYFLTEIPCLFLHYDHIFLYFAEHSYNMCIKVHFFVNSNTKVIASLAFVDCLFP